MSRVGIAPRKDIGLNGALRGHTAPNKDRWSNIVNVPTSKSPYTYSLPQNPGVGGWGGRAVPGPGQQPLDPKGSYTRARTHTHTHACTRARAHTHTLARSLEDLSLDQGSSLLVGQNVPQAIAAQYDEALAGVACQAADLRLRRHVPLQLLHVRACG